MKKKILLFPVFLSLLLAACGSNTVSPPVTPVPSPTPDPCANANLPGEVTKVNDLMREFDDLSLVAQNTPQSQLSQIIPQLQKVLRDAENQAVPSCLQTLKKLQLNHMNAVIQTLLVLLSNPSPSQDTVSIIQGGVAQARDFHNQYDLELARLLGVTIAPSPTPMVSGTPQSVSTPGTTVTVTNGGTAEITLLSAPDATAGGVATLAAGAATSAFGQTADGKWIQVEVPGQAGQKAWVDATLVTASGLLPVVNP